MTFINRSEIWSNLGRHWPELTKIKESGLEAHQFYPLVQLECSEDLRPFLCGLYTPVCMEDYPKFLPPCRFLCERARAGCEPLMRRYGFSVSYFFHFNCKVFYLVKIFSSKNFSGRKKWTVHYCPMKSLAIILTAHGPLKRRLRPLRCHTIQCNPHNFMVNLYPLAKIASVPMNSSI